MPGSEHGPSIKNPKVYEALLRKGYSKEKAARISNAMVDREVMGLPAAARAIFTEAFDRAVDDDPERAHAISMSSVKRKYKKVGDRWVSKDGDAVMSAMGDKEFSGERRKKLAKEGKAMPHGGYPIENEADLKNAIRAFGRAKNKPATKAWIKKRARALGKTELLPENWDAAMITRDTAPIYDEWMEVDDVKICPTCGGDGVLEDGKICPTCEGQGHVAPADPFVKGVGPAGKVNVRLAAPSLSHLGGGEVIGSGAGVGSSGDDDDERNVIQTIARHVRFSKKIKSLMAGEANLGDKREPPDDDDDDDDDEDAKDALPVQLIDGSTNVIDKVGRTKDGYLVADARIARTGIQLYRGDEIGVPDMEVVRVYRPPEEVFSKASMHSLANLPITLNHPPTMVDANNWDQYAVGHIGEEVTRDGDCVRVPLIIMDAKAIEAFEKHGFKQLSVGYATDLKWGEGRTPGGKVYDAKQTAIRGNHLAVVPAARGGSRLSIGDDDQKGDSPMVKLLIDGQSIGFDDELVAKHVQNYIAALQTQLEDAKKKNNGDKDDADEEQEEEKKTRAEKDAAFAAMTGEVAALKKQLEDANAKLTGKAFHDAVKEQINLLMKAGAAMDGKADFTDKEPAEIRRTVVLAKMGDAAKDLTDAEIVGAFKAVTADIKQRTGVDRLTDDLSLLNLGGGGSKNDPKAIRDAAYDEYVKSQSNAWRPRAAQ